MSPNRSHLLESARARGIAVGALAATLLLVPAGSSSLTAQAASAPGSAHAIIATLELPQDALAVGAGPSANDPIYAVSGDNFTGILHRINPTTFTIDDSVAVGSYPLGVAVTADDTVYVVNARSDTLSVVHGPSMTVTNTVSVPDEPQAVALSRSVDDTIFISSSGSSQKITTLDARTLGSSVQTALGNRASPYGLAVGVDDSVYITSYGANKAFRFVPATTTVSTSLVVSGPIGVAITDDDTVYVSSELGNSLSAYPADDPSGVAVVPVGTQPQGIAVGLDGTVFVANRSSGTVSVVDPVGLTVNETVTVGGSPSSIVRSGSGLIVVANRYQTTVSVIASVTPTLGTSSGLAGSTATISLGGLPAGVQVDDSTVAAITFDGAAAPGWTRVAGTNAWSGLVPAGSGVVPVTVSLRGGNSVNLGSFTYTVVPPPAVPAGPPTDVTGVSGDASVQVGWAAPTSTGSFPVTNYQVMSSPSGGTCLTTGLTCSVTGLRNGVGYTFTVRALTGAGWSPWSTRSTVVTPQRPVTPSMVISGSRGEVRDKPGVVVTGTSTGLGMGALVTIWMRFDDTQPFTAGRARMMVDSSGGFTWERRASRTIELQARTSDGSLTSNTLTIRR